MVAGLLLLLDIPFAANYCLQIVMQLISISLFLLVDDVFPGNSVSGFANLVEKTGSLCSFSGELGTSIGTACWVLLLVLLLGLCFQYYCGSLEKLSFLICPRRKQWKNMRL